MSTDMESNIAILEKEVSLRRRNDKLQKWGLFILAMLLMVTLAVIYLLLQNANTRADVSSATAQNEQEEKKEVAKEAQKALCGTADREIYDRDLCEKWAAIAQEPPAPTPEPPVVIGGPSQADLVMAFREYCAAGNCRGADGEPPTAEETAAAFVRFCADGRCTGPAGKDAQDGKDGESLPPAPEMVLAAVTTYCSTGACVGQPGKDGVAGPGPSPEAILAAVQTVCANDACRGATGAVGAVGPAPSSIRIRDSVTGRMQTCVPDPPGSTDYTCTYDEGLGVKP